MFWCNNEGEAEYVASKGILFINDYLSIKLQRGNMLDMSNNRKLACTGGWIEILDLPLNWWKKEVFKAIGWECGVC